MEGREIFACSWVPEFDEHIFGTGNDKTLCGVPIDASHIPTVATQTFFFLGFSIAPNLDQSIIATGHETLIVRTPTNIMTGFSMPLKTVYICQMRCKVLDGAAFVG